MVAAVAVQPAASVALAVAPDDTCTISRRRVPRSLMATVPAVTLKVSAHRCRSRVSARAAVDVSAPAPPVTFWPFAVSVTVSPKSEAI